MGLLVYYQFADNLVHSLYIFWLSTQCHQILLIARHQPGTPRLRTGANYPQSYNFSA